MATFNALRVAKNDQKKRVTTLSLVIPAGTTVEQLKAGLLLGYTQEKALITNVQTIRTDTSTVSAGNANVLVGTTAIAVNTYHDAVKPIVYRQANAAAALTCDWIVVIEMVETNNTDGYLVGPNTANLRPPLDDQGNACVEFPDIAPNTRAF